MKFIFDRCVPVRLARMLAEYDAEHSVGYLDDHFDNTTPDEVWIRDLASHNPRPVLITSDLAIRRNAIERQALRDSGLTVVFLGRSLTAHLPMHTLAVKILTLWPEIVREVTDCREPTAFEIKATARKVGRISKTADL